MCFPGMIIYTVPVACLVFTLIETKIKALEINTEFDVKRTEVET